jgi:hypothetical protein
MSDKIDKIPVGVSANIFATFHLHNLNLVDALAELIDNSIGGHDRLNSQNPAEIDLLLEDDSLVIVDNGIGLSRNDFETALITYDQNDMRLKGATYNTYGYGLKGSAFWIGNRLQIESCSHLDNKFYQCVMDITKISPELQPVPTVNLLSDLIPAGTEVFYTKITISNINAHNYELGSVSMNRIVTCLGHIYHPLIRLGKLVIRINGEVLAPIERVYLKSYPHSCYTKINSKEYYINSSFKNNALQEWKFPVDIKKTYNNVCYEVGGYIGMSDNNQEGNKGIRVYRKNRGLLGCNTLYNQYNPLKLQSRSSADLFHIGELHISSSFTKPPIGGNNALLEIEILNEMIMEVYQSEPFMGFKSQLNNFKVHMGKAGHNSPPIPVPVAPRPINTPITTGTQKPGNGTGGDDAIPPIVIVPNAPATIEKEYRIDDKSYKVSYLFDKNLPNSTFNWVNTPNDANSIRIDFKLKSDLELIKMFVKLIDKHSEMQNEDGETYAKIVKQLLN